MTELLAAVLDWRLLLLGLLVFGFAPGLALRLIVLFYPSGHVRRRELYAELQAVPFIERPLFVAQQLETGLFDGLGQRVSARRAVKPTAESSLPASRQVTDADTLPDHDPAAVGRWQLQRLDGTIPMQPRGSSESVDVWFDGETDAANVTNQMDLWISARGGNGDSRTVVYELKHRRGRGRWRAGEAD